MSLFGAMQSGVSGLAAQSTAMGAISDNISNVNTIGYKNNAVSFSTLVTAQTSTNFYSPGGVQPVTKQSVNVQGLLASTSSSTALAVSGNGYFVVNSAANPGEGDVWAYTRAGDFDIDDNGYLVNTGGFYLQGWSLLPWDGNANASVVNINGINYMKAYYDSNGDTIYVNDNIVDSRNLRPINLSTIGGSATATQQIKYGANLPSSDPVFDPSVPSAGGQHSISALIYDSLGNASNMNLTYTKTSSNTWAMSTNIPSGAATVVLTGNTENFHDIENDVYYASGQLEFNSIPQNGSIISIKDNQTGQTFNFEFISEPGQDAQPGNIKVDISSGITSVSDFVEAFNNSIQSVMPGAGRFSADSNKITIVQSTGGGSLSIDASRTLACVQSAANPDESTGIPTGKFNIPEIDSELTNVANISFTSNPNDGDTIEIDDVTYTFKNSPDTGDSTQVQIPAGGFDGVSLVENLVAAIRQNMTEPERVTASGTTIEFTPSTTGPDMVLDFRGVSGHIAGTSRNGTVLDADPATTVIKLENTFSVNNTDLESGSMVPGVKFDGNGLPQYYYVSEMEIEWANGAKNMNGDYNQGTPITLIQGNVGTNDGLTSLSGSFTTNYIKQDGAQFGSYAGVSISEDGVVTALYDNGETRPIAILPLATFTNPNGMTALTGNAWIETDASGQALLKMANTNGAGTIESNSLEQSTGN